MFLNKIETGIKKDNSFKNKLNIMANRVQLLGRIGQPPEVRHLENGQSVANFSIATSEKYTDKNGEKKEITDWHRVTFWGKIAEVVDKYVNKGDLIYVEGKIRTRSWEKDNVTHYTTEIIGSSLEMLGSKPSEERSTTPPPSLDDVPDNQGDNDDLPF